ncbi:hypothetical protein D018_1259B, partial [Vibrio parahaemolyticus VP2007-007]
IQRCTPRYQYLSGITLWNRNGISQRARN